MAKFRVFAKYLVPVETFVYAESEEEAMRIAKTRELGYNMDEEWVLDESDFAKLGDLN